MKGWLKGKFGGNGESERGGSGRFGIGRAVGENWLEGGWIG